MSQAPKTPKMRMKLGEENQLKFSLSVKGASTPPTLRFLVTEEKTGLSLCFPMKQLEEGKIGVTIPDLPGIFKEGVDYLGRVEIIAGSKYFNPTSVNLNFEGKLEVSAEPLLEEVTKEEKAEAETLDFDSLVKPVMEATEEPSRKVSVEIDADTLREAIFKARAKVIPPPPPVKVQAPPPAPKVPLDPRTQKIKSQLKNMISEAWNELGK